MKKLYEETAVQDIAAAIREKNGTATKYKVAEMGDAVRRCLNTGVETEVYTFDQCRAEVDRYLKNVTYNPSDYAVSQIPEYVTTVSANRPVGVDIVMKSAGTLTIVDGYTGNSVSQPVSAGAITIYNCTPGSISTFALLVDGKVIQQGVIKPTGACRMIHLLNVGNVRDLGGWDCDGGMVKYGLLFRGGEMYGYLTDDGRQQAIDMLGILKEIDLRFASELNGRTESGFGPTVDMLWVDMTWNDLSYCTAITADTGCEVSNVKIMMGGEDVSTFYKDGVIAIPEVIGDIVITATAVAQAPAYTNLLDAAIDMDGNVIGHTPMYKNMRYNSSSGAPVAHSGTNITGLLPVKKGDVVRIRWKGNTDISYQSIKFFKSDRTQVKVGYTSLANIEKGQAGPVINFNAANGDICSK